MTGTNIHEDVVALSINATRDFTTPMLVWINLGVDLIVGKRSDSLIDSNGNAITVTRLTALTDTVSIPDKFRGPLVDYCLSRYFAQFGKDALQLKRSETHLNFFYTTLKDV